MAVRPARKEVLSTRPIYLPVLPSKELSESAGRAGPTEDVALFTDIVQEDAPDLETVKAALADWGVRVELRGDFFAGRLLRVSGTERRDAAAAAAHALAWARIRNPARREYGMLPLRGEIDYESARVHARLHPGFGRGGLDAGSYSADLLYDWSALQQVYRSLLPGGPAAANRAVVITDRALGGWSEAEGAWQPRSVVAGHPGIVSIHEAASRPELDVLVRAALYQE